MLNTGGKTPKEITNFPMIEGEPPLTQEPTPEQSATWRPITVGGKMRWTDEPITQDDADPNGAELP